MELGDHPLMQNLPDLGGIEVEEFALGGLSAEALIASNVMAKQGYYALPMPAGFRVGVESMMLFNGNGMPIGGRSNAAIVVDPSSDAVLAAIAVDVQSRFGEIPQQGRSLPKLLTGYVRLLTEPKGRQAQEDCVINYHSYVLQNQGRLVLLGWLTKNRLGTCLIMALLLKYVADVLQLPLAIMQGAIITDLAEQHVWCAREEDGTVVAYDSARYTYGEPMTKEKYEVDAIPS